MNENLTVVIPYFNEEHVLPFTLLRISKQTMPPKEVIFVNSSSTDRSFKLINDWIALNQEKYVTKFINLDANTKNPATSKNVGIKMCHTTYIAFMDCGQEFEENWLESQWNFMIKEDAEIVSGGVILSGTNWIDFSAVAQTFGYNRFRPCIPTSIVKLSVFNKTGLFLDRRSGYDADWQLLVEKLKIKRSINKKVIIRYIGTNFSSDLYHLIKKTFKYSVPTALMPNYKVPYYYCLFLIFLIISSVISLKLFFIVFGQYIFIRGYLIPIAKSRSMRVILDHWYSVLSLPIIGVMIDVIRTIGILFGIWKFKIEKQFVKTNL